MVTIFLGLSILALFLWMIQRFLDIERTPKVIIQAIVLLIAAVWLFSHLGVIHLPVY